MNFHSPKSSESRQFTPIWKKLSENLAKVEDLLIANFDVDNNELLDLDIDTYPTLKFYPKNFKEGIDYEEDEHDIDTLMSWLIDNSKVLREATYEKEIKSDL